MNNTNKFYSMTMDEIVFEHRNKSYGAYELRTIWPQHIRTGMFLTFLGFALFLSATQINWNLFGNMPTKDIASVIEISDVSIPKVDVVTPKPIIASKPLPVQNATQKFTQIFVRQNNLETIEDEVTRVEDIGERQISNETQNGIDEPIIIESSTTLGTISNENDKTYTVVQQMPEYIGGEQALFEYLRNNINYPSMEKENDIQGTVILRFVVLEDGSVGSIEVLRAISNGLAKEASRVVKQLKFSPGIQQGKTVKVFFTLPVKFTLN